MTSKNKIAILLFIVAASLSLWLYLHNSKGTIRKELYDFAVSDTGAITKIYMISTEGKQITLEKTKPGEWMVSKKFKARNDALKHLLTCIKDIQVRNPVAKSGIENISKQLATTSTKVEIYQNDKMVKMYYVGGDTQDGLGTFMLLSDPETGENSSLPFVMYIPGFNGFLSIRYMLDEDLWKERIVFSFYPDQISSISVEYPHLPDSSFSISLANSNTISMMDSKGNNIPDFDTLIAKRYITYYTNIQYETLKNDLRKSFQDSIFAKGPVHIIKLKDPNRKTYSVKTFSKPNDGNPGNDIISSNATEDPERMFALIHDDKDIVLIQYFVFGKLFQGPSYFKKPKAGNKKIDVKK